MYTYFGCDIYSFIPSTITENICELVRKRKWTWIGHVLRMGRSSLPRFALTSAMEEKRKSERPKETLRRIVEKERMEMGFNTWAG